MVFQVLTDARVLFSPEWFRGFDTTFDFIALVATILIALYSHNLYQFSGEKKHFYFSLSFASIAGAFFFKVLGSLTLYYVVTEFKTIGVVQVVTQSVQIFNSLTLLGALAFYVLMLLGFGGIYMIVNEIHSWKNAWLISYFVIIVAGFSISAFYLSHLTAILFLIFIVQQYYLNHKKKPRKKAIKHVYYSFGLILLSQVAFLFNVLNPLLYVVGEFLQLGGYILILYTYYQLVSKK